MVKHIVLWKLKDQDNGMTAEEAAAEIKRRLEALAGRIPGLTWLEVGIDMSPQDEMRSVALYSEFTDRDALAAYQVHPDHVAAAEFIRSLRPERSVVDYEV